MSDVSGKRDLRQIDLGASLSKEDFLAIYHQYHVIVRGAVYRCGVKTDLDDVVQEIFVKVWKSWSNFQGKSSLKTWILKIAMHTTYDKLRKKKIESVEFKEEHVLVGTPSEEDLREAVFLALQKLKLSHRQTLILAIYEGYSVEEISKLMSVPTGTVKSRLHNARNEMADILRKMGVRYGDE